MNHELRQGGYCRPNEGVKHVPVTQDIEELHDIVAEQTRVNRISITPSANFFGRVFSDVLTGEIFNNRVESALRIDVPANMIVGPSTVFKNEPM